MARRKYFQDHGDHLQTLVPMEEFLEQVLPTITDWVPVAAAKAPIPAKPKTDFIALRKEDADVSFLGLVAVTPKYNRFMSSYPIAKGNIVEATITDIYEWKEPYEAYVWASVNDEFDFCFFATDYFCNKEKYVKGAKLQLEVAALGMQVEPGNEDIKLDPEEAMKFYEHMEGGPDLDEEGNIAPLVMSCAELVALLPASNQCPDFFEFHSPIISYEDITIEGKEFGKVGIVISHDPDDIEIPLYFNKALGESLEESENVRGVLWLQAHIPNAFSSDEQ